MPVSIRLSSETEQRLTALAAETGRTKSFYLRELIEGGLNDIEDYYLRGVNKERIRQRRTQPTSNTSTETESKEK